MFLALSIAIVIGSIAGWLISESVGETGFGFLGDILIGIIGASIAALTFPMLHLDLGHGLIPWAIATVVGAVTLLLVACLIKLTVAASRT
jgi:uncharacterized membrane protein YeaQ/YmgE (transglycosylase-associated protein family)